MILVLLGTQNYSFRRLLEEIQKCIDKGLISQEVIVQSGGTKFTSSQMKLFSLIGQENLKEMISKADLIITHGGVGSIVSSVKLHKKVIAVPRLEKYGEVSNDHQIQIIETFANEGFIIGLHDVSELEDALQKVKDFEPKTLKSNTENIIKLIRNYIENH